MSASEEWRPIAGYASYEVSSLGRVRRIVRSAKGHPPRVMSPHKNNKGYLVISLSDEGVLSRFLVSRLVCTAFHGDPAGPRYDAAHGDGDVTNNTPGNLRWATRSENMEDSRRHGTMAMGSSHGRRTKPHRTPRGTIHGHAKLSEADITAIRAHSRAVGTGRALADRYGVSPALISNIRNRKIWKHL